MLTPYSDSTQGENKPLPQGGVHMGREWANPHDALLDGCAPRSCTHTHTPTTLSPPPCPRYRGQRAMRAAANEPTSSFKLYWIKSCEVCGAWGSGVVRQNGVCLVLVQGSVVINGPGVRRLFGGEQGAIIMPGFCTVCGLLGHGKCMLLPRMCETRFGSGGGCAQLASGVATPCLPPQCVPFGQAEIDAGPDLGVMNGPEPTQLGCAVGLTAQQQRAPPP
jgi:hypothetical protein